MHQEDNIAMTNNMSNGQITDLQEGDDCYYLSIPFENDWFKAKCLSGKFIARNYQQCNVSRSKEEIDNLCRKLHALFSGCKKGSIIEGVETIDVSRIATDSTVPYYHIYLSTQSDSRVIDYKKEDGNTLKDQTKYHNNHFSDEDYTVEIANRISKILGISTSVKKHA